MEDQLFAAVNATYRSINPATISYLLRISSGQKYPLPSSKLNHFVSAKPLYESFAPAAHQPTYLWIPGEQETLSLRRRWSLDHANPLLPQSRLQCHEQINSGFTVQEHHILSRGLLSVLLSASLDSRLRLARSDGKRVHRRRRPPRAR